ncbi:MAG: hypothetical protein IT176_13280 [Acidobacteria bacterium]|nr:hypothetical protein [Acidobacteriota bacterium]
MTLSRLSILVFPETIRTWTARALERDLSASGNSVETAIDTLLKVARAHIVYDLRHGREPLSAFGAAPQIYRNAFAGSMRVPIPMELSWDNSGAPIQILAATAERHPAIRPPSATAARIA